MPASGPSCLTRPASSYTPEETGKRSDSWQHDYLEASGVLEHLLLDSSQPILPARSSTLTRSQSDFGFAGRRRSFASPSPAPSSPLPASPGELQHILALPLSTTNPLPNRASFASSTSSSPDLHFRNSFHSVSTEITVPSRKGSHDAAEGMASHERRSSRRSARKEGYSSSEDDGPWNDRRPEEEQTLPSTGGTRRPPKKSSKRPTSQPERLEPRVPSRGSSSAIEHLEQPSVKQLADYPSSSQQNTPQPTPHNLALPLASPLAGTSYLNAGSNYLGPSASPAPGPSPLSSSPPSHAPEPPPTSSAHVYPAFPSPGRLSRQEEQETPKLSKMQQPILDSPTQSQPTLTASPPPRPDSPVLPTLDERVASDDTPLMSERLDSLDEEPELPEIPHPRGPDYKPGEGEAGPLKSANQVIKDLEASEKLRKEPPPPAAVAALNSSSEYSILGAMWENSNIGVPTAVKNIGVPDAVKRMAAWRWSTAGAAPASATDGPPSPSSSSALESADEAPTPEDPSFAEVQATSPQVGKVSPSSTSSGRLTPTAIETEYGIIHGPVPEGFEEEFKKAMAALGEGGTEAEAASIASDRSFKTAGDDALHVDTSSTTLRPLNPRASEDEEYERESSLSPLPPRMARLEPDRLRRSPSVAASVTSELSTAPSSSDSSSTTKRKSKILGIFGKKKSSSISSDMAADAPYVHYGTGRSSRQGSLSSSSPSSRARSASIASSSSTVEDGEHQPTSPSAQPLRSCMKMMIETRQGRRSSRAGNVFNVRFANATRGLGLRTVAEKEAEHAGGTDHALAWVGVGRGRYGNLIIEGQEGSDEVYAAQVTEIRRKWRAFGSRVSNEGWSQVKVD